MASDPKLLRATRNRDGKPGVHVPLIHEAGGWSSNLSFDTHGMTPAEAVAHREKLKARHERKAARLTDLSSLIGRALPGGWHVTDATIRDVGAEQCQLLCRAAKGTGRVSIMKHFNDPGDVPTAAEVLALMRQRVEALIVADAGLQKHAADVAAALGEGAP